MDSQSLAAAFLLGFFGSSHCLAMCGGIAASFSLHDKHNSLTVCAFNGGRIIGYGVIGALVGSLFFLGDLLPQLYGGLAGTLLRVFAGLMLVAMGLYVGNFWFGLRRLEAAGQIVWQGVQPLVQSLMPAKTPWHAIPLGILWSLLPCGLIYSALLWSLGESQSSGAGMLMLFFGLGTLPMMLATGLFAGQLNRIRSSVVVRRMMAVLLIAMGCWTAYIAVQHHSMHSESNDDEHSHHHHH